MLVSSRQEGVRMLRMVHQGVVAAQRTWSVARPAGPAYAATASFASSSRCHEAESEKNHLSSARTNFFGKVKGKAKAKAESEDASSSSTSTDAILAPKDKDKKRKPGMMDFDIASFPSLLEEAHPVLDAYRRTEIPPSGKFSHGASVTFFNEHKLFVPQKPNAAALIATGGTEDGDEVDSASMLASLTPLSATEVNNMHRHLLKIRRVTQQTGKGRFSRMSALVVAGNGRGMVGYGDGKDLNAGNAARKAFHAAVKNMDYVERHNNHTIPAEVTGKWSATRVTLRPRPQGFGLRVPHVIHAIARSAGITDLSASISGSPNPINVVKATLSLLWGGSAPMHMGDGASATLRRQDRGVGMRTVRDIELARGRRLRPVDVAAASALSKSE